jgi:hypothetical protein
LTGKKISVEPTMVFILYISTEKKGQANHQNTRKTKDQRKGGKTQCSSGQQKEQATKAQRSKIIEL